MQNKENQTPQSNGNAMGTFNEEPQCHYLLQPTAIEFKPKLSHPPCPVDEFRPQYNRNGHYRHRQSMPKHHINYRAESLLQSYQRQPPLLAHVPAAPAPAVPARPMSRSSSITSLGSHSTMGRARAQQSAMSMMATIGANQLQRNGAFQESRYKTELCRAFDEIGTCEYGDRCLYAHGLDELKHLPNRHPKFKTERCSAFNDLGYCVFGQRCAFVHEHESTEQILEKIWATMDVDTMVDFMESNDISLPLVDNRERLPVFKRITSKSNGTGFDI